MQGFFRASLGFVLRKPKLELSFERRIDTQRLMQWSTHKKFYMACNKNQSGEHGKCFHFKPTEQNILFDLLLVECKIVVIVGKLKGEHHHQKQICLFCVMLYSHQIIQDFPTIYGVATKKSFSGCVFSFTLQHLMQNSFKKCFLNLTPAKFCDSFFVHCFFQLLQPTSNYHAIS